MFIVPPEFADTSRGFSSENSKYGLQYTPKRRLQRLLKLKIHLIMPRDGKARIILKVNSPRARDDLLYPEDRRGLTMWPVV